MITVVIDLFSTKYTLITSFLQGHDYLGMSLATPKVVIFKEDALTSKLSWFPVVRGTEQGGEILAAFELYQVYCPINQLSTKSVVH